MATQTPLQHVGAILHGLLGQFAGDVLINAQGLLATFGGNLVTNPSETNVIAQSLALAATAPLQLPNLESTAIKQFGEAVVQLSALIPQLAPPTPAP